MKLRKLAAVLLPVSASCGVLAAYHVGDGSRPRPQPGGDRVALSEMSPAGDIVRCTQTSDYVICPRRGPFERHPLTGEPVVLVDSGERTGIREWTTVTE